MSPDFRKKTNRHWRKELLNTKQELGPQLHRSSQRLIKTFIYFSPPDVSSPLNRSAADSWREPEPSAILQITWFTWFVSFSRLVWMTSSCTSPHCGISTARVTVREISLGTALTWSLLGSSGVTVWRSLHPLLPSAAFLSLSTHLPTRPCCSSHFQYWHNNSARKAQIREARRANHPL